MIVGIVVLHVPPYVPLNETTPGVFSFIKAFFSGAVFRSAVPVLTCISGYLLFSSSLDLDYRKLFSKKTKTILLPLIVWNLPLLVVLYFIQANSLLDQEISAPMYPFAMVSWINGIFGVFGEPINYPLNFLRDLYVLALLAPLFGFLLRRLPVLGFLLIFFGFMNDLEGQLVLRNTMAINFYIGGMAAILSWNLKCLDRYAGRLFFLFLVICVLIVVFQIEDRSLFYIFIPYCVWPFTSVIANSRFGEIVGNLAKYSFFIFLSHSIFLIGISNIYATYIGKLHSVSFWLIAPVLTILAAQGCYLVLAKCTPGFLSFLVGGRLEISSASTIGKSISLKNQISRK